MTLAEALRHANVQAFLRVIRERESSQDESAYTVINGGAHFTSFADHPFAGMSTTQGGRAAGAYQFIPSTWAEVAKQNGFTDFSPPNQDLGAVARIVYRGALDDVIAGRIESAIAKCRKEWTSLPGASESSSAWTMVKALAVYQQWGGHFTPETQPAAPIEDLADKADVIRKEQPMFPLLAALLPTVLQMFSPKAAQEINTATTGKPADALAPFLLSLFSKITEATGKADPVEAVAALKEAPPEKIEAVQTHALASLSELMPLFDKLAEFDKQTAQIAREGRDAASERALRDRWDMTPWLVLFAGGTATVVVLALLGAIIYQAVTGDRQIDGVLIGLAGPLLAISMAVWREIFGYRFDGTPTSNAANAINAELQARRPM
jgi:muramidase (phage lysozyme)